MEYTPFETLDGESHISTRDICALMGFTPQALRYYEKFNRDKRYRSNDATGYREFHFESVVQLFNFRNLSRSGVALKDVSSTIEGSDLGDLESLYGHNRDRLLKQREEIDELIDANNEQERLIREAETFDGTFKLCWSPDLWVLPIDTEKGLPHDTRTRQMISEWSKHTPPVFLAPTVYGPPFGEQSVARIEFAVETRFSSNVPIEEPIVQRVPAHRCFCGVATVTDAYKGREHPGEGTWTTGYYAVIKNGLEQAVSTGLELAGPIRTRLIAADVPQKDNSTVDYYYLWIPVAHDGDEN